jgi:hypothetical protein
MCHDLSSTTRERSKGLHEFFQDYRSVLERPAWHCCIQSVQSLLFGFWCLVELRDLSCEPVINACTVSIMISDPFLCIWSRNYVPVISLWYLLEDHRLMSNCDMQITMSALREWAASQGGDVHKVRYASSSCHSFSSAVFRLLALLGFRLQHASVYPVGRANFEAGF